MLDNSTVSGTQIQQTYNVVSCGSGDTTIKMVKSDTIVDNQTSVVEDGVTKIEDESDLSVTDFKMLCFFYAISDNRFRCKLPHDRYNIATALSLYKPSRNNLQGHLTNVHEIKRKEIADFTEYSEGSTTITFESLVIFIFCAKHNFIFNF